MRCPEFILFVALLCVGVSWAAPPEKASKEKDAFESLQLNVEKLRAQRILGRGLRTPQFPARLLVSNIQRGPLNPVTGLAVRKIQALEAEAISLENVLQSLLTVIEEQKETINHLQKRVTVLEIRQREIISKPPR